jgi:hypothetical protein
VPHRPRNLKARDRVGGKRGGWARKRGLAKHTGSMDGVESMDKLQVAPYGCRRVLDPDKLQVQNPKSPQPDVGPKTMSG